MLNRWELEEDEDSDGEFPIQRTKTSSGGRSPAINTNLQGHQKSNSRLSNQNHSARTSSGSGVSDAMSRSFYTDDDDDDDLDAEELPHRSKFESNVGQGRQNGGNHVEHLDSYVAKNVYTNNSKGLTQVRSLSSMDTITIQELDDAFGDGLSKAASSRTPGGEVEVDKIELARAVRYIGVPALADDILNISTWRVSWNVLLAVARPYTLRDNSDGTPIKDEASSMQQILKPRGSRPSSLSRQSSGDLKSKRLSVAFEPLESDNEKEQMRPKTAMRSQDLPSRSQFAPVVSSSTEWSSQIRQPRGDLKLTKSMDQESWHDADRSQSYYSDDNNIGQGPNSSSIRHPREDLSRSPDVSKLSLLDNGRRRGEQSVESERTQTRTEAQKRWAGRSIEVEGCRNDSNFDESRHAEEEAYDKYDTSKWSPPQSMPKKDNRLQLSPGGSPAPRRKSITEQTEGLGQRRQDTHPMIERPKTGSMSPLLFPKPTTTSLSPSKLNSRELKSNMTGSSDSSVASGPHPMASSWETAVSPRSEGDQSGDGKGLTPAKPPRPQSLQSHLPPAFAAEKPMRPSMSMTPAMSMNKSLYGDRSQMKRSISWSAAVSSEFTKPPRTKSASYVLSSSFNSSSWDSEAQEGFGDGLAGSQDLERHVVLSPLSEYALRTGVIIEGWLEKKSAVTGFWQKRYFVLAESSTEFCVLRIYYKVVESSWGTIPLKKKSSIPIGTVKSVAPISTKIKQGKQFSVTFKISDGEKASSLSSGLLTRSRRGSDATLGSRPGEGSELGEGDSDGERDGNDNSRSKSMILKAEDLKTRMLWTTMLGKVLRYHIRYEHGEDDYAEEANGQ